MKNAVESPRSTSSSSASTLSTSEIAGGLKAALEKAAKTAVSSLGAKDGYLGNTDVKIPVSGALSKVESALRLVGQSNLADSFVTSMNRAAEQAAAETLDIPPQSHAERGLMKYPG